eukprot:366039-Chlamydomonas_euryale.AAC.18
MFTHISGRSLGACDGSCGDVWIVLKLQSDVHRSEQDTGVWGLRFNARVSSFKLTPPASEFEAPAWSSQRHSCFPQAHVVQAPYPINT